MMFYKNHFRARRFYFRNSFFTLNSGLCYKETTVFSKACLFFCSSYFTDQSLIKKESRGMEKHLKRRFATQKLEKGFAIKGFLVNQANTNKKPIRKREKKRSSLILPKHIGRVFFVHNGKTFSSIQIYRKMLGHKFGEFASTRKKPVHKKKRSALK